MPKHAAILLTSALFILTALAQEVAIQDGKYHIVSGEFGKTVDNQYLSLHTGPDFVAPVLKTLAGALATVATTVLVLMIGVVDPIDLYFLLHIPAVFLALTITWGTTIPSRKKLTLKQNRQVSWRVRHSKSATEAHPLAFELINAWAASKLRQNMTLGLTNGGMKLRSSKPIPIVALKGDGEAGEQGMVYLKVLGSTVAQLDQYIYLTNGKKGQVTVTLDEFQKSLWKLKKMTN